MIALELDVERVHIVPAGLILYTKLWADKLSDIVLTLVCNFAVLASHRSTRVAEAQRKSHSTLGS